MKWYYYTGEIIAFAGNFVPENFHLCDGSLLKTTEYRDLFQVIKTTFGGDGQSNFALPNLKGLVVVGTNNSAAYSLGAKRGSATVKLTQTTMPSHRHNLLAAIKDATTGDPNGNLLAASNSPDTTVYPNVSAYIEPVSKPQSMGMLNGAAIAPAGENKEHENRMPYLTINYLICLKGQNQ